MLIAVQVPRISIRVRKLSITRFLYVCIVTDSEICTIAESGSKIHRVKNRSFLINEVHFLLQGHRKQKRLLLYIRMNGIVGRSPCHRCITSDNFIKLCSHENYGILLAVAILMKSFHWKIVIRGTVEHLGSIHADGEDFFDEGCILFALDDFRVFELEWLLDLYMEIFQIQ